MDELIIGLDIGGTKIAGCLTDRALNVRRSAVVLTRGAEGPEAVLEAAVGLAQSLRADAAGQVTAVGVGVTGILDPAEGVIRDANPNIRDWTGTPVKARLEAALGLPVFIENDVNAIAVAECQVGAGRGWRHLLYIAVGTGVGGALVLNGQLWTGVHFSAGEVGYLYAGEADGEPRMLEQRCAGPALERTYRAHGGDALDLRAIAGRAAAGEALARSVIQDGARLLGQIIGPALCVIDPEALIVGGGVPGIGPLWWEPFEATLRAAPFGSVAGLPILRAALGPDAGMIGAAALAAR